MSHHLDSPLARKDPRLNITDQFLFDDEGATVLIMDCNTSLAGATPGFHPEARYEFKVHLDGADRESVCLRFAFDPADDTGAQMYVLTRLEGDAAADDDAAGTVLATGRTGETTTTDEGVRVWAGRARDPFYLDLTKLKAVIGAVQHGADLDVGDWTTPATSTFAGSTVCSIVVALPSGDTQLTPGRQIAMWSAAKLATDAGGWHQVNRAGLPMIWPIFRDDTSEDASHADQGHPGDDTAQYAKAIADLVAATVEHAGSAADPDGYGKAVAHRLLPDVLSYQVGTAAGLTFAGHNGRTLSDNAPEVMFSLATNSAVPTGLDAAITSDLRTATFPFVVPSPPDPTPH